MGARDLKKRKKKECSGKKIGSTKTRLAGTPHKEKHGVAISRWIDIRRRRNDKGYHRDFASENTSPKTKLAKATAAARTVFFSTREFFTSHISL